MLKQETRLCEFRKWQFDDFFLTTVVFDEIVSLSNDWKKR